MRRLVARSITWLMTSATAAIGVNALAHGNPRQVASDDLTSSLPQQPVAPSGRTTTGAGRAAFLPGPTLAPPLDCGGGLPRGRVLETGPSVIGAVSMDLDGDGVMDLITSHPDVNSMGVLQGTGGGYFESPFQYDIGGEPSGVAAADIDGDGDSDLLVLVQLPFSSLVKLSVQLNQGGQLGSPVTYDVNGGPGGLKIADLDGDGDMDVVASSGGFNRLNVLLNSGAGIFGPSTTYQLDPPGVSFAIGDVDEDGFPDVVTANQYQSGIPTATLLLNAGDGTFPDRRQINLGRWGPFIELADMDGDGHLDLVTANGNQNGSSGVSVARGTGNGDFGTGINSFAPIQVSGLELADLNGNGVLDLVLTYKQINWVAALIGTGDGHFSSPAYDAAGLKPSATVVVDVHGDGNEDILTVNPETGSITLLLGRGNGTFVAPKVIESPHARCMASADVDGDGDMDLLVSKSATLTPKVRVYLNVGGNNIFAPPIRFDALGFPTSMISVDLNGDDTPDVVTANLSDGTVSVLTNLGGGTLAPQAAYAVDGCARDLASADVDGDGDMDILTVCTAMDTISVMLNQGDATLDPALDYGTAPTPQAVACVDIDGDGDPDAVTANGLSQSVSVLLNMGDGTFASHYDYNVPGSARDIETADVNGDGDVDLVVCLADRISVLLGAGDGTFSSPVQYSIGDGACSLQMVDIDGDGDTDVLVAHRFEDRVTLMKNAGDGTYPFQRSFSHSEAPIEFLVEDFDGDGTPDVTTLYEGSDVDEVVILWNYCR